MTIVHPVRVGTRIDTQREGFVGEEAATPRRHRLAPPRALADFVAAHPWILLVACVVVAAPVGGPSPGPALDDSWALALNLAHIRGLQFGPQILFTYGPWGFLDVPLNISRGNLLLGGLFAVGAVACAWLGFYRAFTRAVPVAAAAVSAAALVTVLALGSQASGLMLVGLTLVALDYVASDEARRSAWLPAALAGASALLTQVKFSEGLTLAGVAITCAVFAPSRRLRRIAEALAALVAGTCVLWLIAGQSVSHLAAWIHGSVEVSLGYTEAMSHEQVLSNWLTYAVLVAVVLVVGVQVARGFRTAPARSASAVGIVSVALLYLGFREGYGRHDLVHQPFFYLTSTGLLAWLIGWPTRATLPRVTRTAERVGRAMRVGRVPRNVALCVVSVLLTCVVARQAFSESAPREFLSVATVLLAAALLAIAKTPVLRCCALLAVAALMAMASPGLSVVTVAKDWAAEARTLGPGSYRDQHTEAAAGALRDSYAISPSLVSTIAHHPVAVDNFDTSVVWAYGFSWRPAPVFQQYSAYTAYLDELNAKSIRTASDEQLILRANESVDGRNPVWDPPRYVLTEVCDFRPVGSDTKWLLLQKTTNRCSTPATLRSVSVTANEAIPVPAAAADGAVLMSFTPDGPSLVDRLQRSIDKPRHPLFVHGSGASTGPQDFRLPRALASGPLIVRFPAAAQWPALFGGTEDFDEVSFTEPGTVTFSSVSVRR